MKFGIASRPILGLNMNGDAYVTEEWNGQTLVAVLDGLGHGEEANMASAQAKVYILQNRTKDVEQLILGLHADLHTTRGIAIGLAKIDRTTNQLFFCGIGNIEASIIGEPPMHPISLDGIVGMSLRKVKRFEYRYDLLKAVILHSDGISSKFDMSDYPASYEDPQKTSEQILNEWGKKHDDATILIAVEDNPSIESTAEIAVANDLQALVAGDKAIELAKRLGFSECDQAKIGIATCELARNIVLHAEGKGRILVHPIRELGKIGIMIVAEDKGPGITDINEALQGANGSKKGLGIGLSGAKRLTDEFEVKSKIGEGTTIIAKKWKKQPLISEGG
jgi:anti-sigma regulatory factor (Ser/Thr protein kinase)